MADLSIGVTEVFTTCLYGYDIVTTALSATEDQQQQLHRIRIQRARLVVWGDHFGIDGTSSSPSRFLGGGEKLQIHLRSNIRVGIDILDALHAIAEVLVNGRKLQDTYGLAKVRDPRDRAALLDPDVVDIALQGVNKLAMSKVRLDKNRTAILYLGQCDWHIQDPGRFETLLILLRGFNDNLYSLVLPTARELMHRALIAELLSGQNNVRELLHLHNAADIEADDMLPPTKGFFSASYHTLSQAAKLRARGNIDPFLKRRLLRPPTLLVREDYQLHTSAAWAGGDACLAVSHSQRRVVLVEFKSYHIDGRAHRKLEDVVHKLAEMLCADNKPSEFRLLECSGYFHDPPACRYGFVYELPTYLHLRHPDEIRTGGLSLRKPHSLIALLRQLTDPIDLSTRFSLAKQLVAALYMIHACGFLHKNIRPVSILFLPAESGDRRGGPSKSRRVALGKPYLMGWGFTRPDDMAFEPAATTKDERGLVVVTTRDKDVGIYQHPEWLKYPNRGYRASYDIYSLGLVLLEIGLWQSIDSFIGDIKDFTTDEFRGFLRSRVVPDLRGQCGSVYESVVQQCLGMRVDMEEDAVEKTLLWDIMAKIRECKA